MLHVMSRARISDSGEIILARVPVRRLLRRQFCALGVSALVGLRTLHRRPLALWVFVAWVAAIAADDWTTLMMMNSGLFEEANPIAALGMGTVTKEVYTAGTSVVCLGFAVLSTVWPRGLYARTVVVMCLLIGIAKAHTAISNYLLWASVGG